MEHDFVILTNRNEVKTDDTPPIARYFKNRTGRAKLAAAMAAPIRRSLDYQGIARKCLVVDQLPQGALPAYVPQRVVMPQFEIYANPTIKIADVKQRRFNIIDRKNWGRYYDVVVITARNKVDSYVSA